MNISNSCHVVLLSLCYLTPVCFLSCLQIIEWLCDNVNAFESFDQFQEFILGQCQLKHEGMQVSSVSLLLALRAKPLSCFFPLRSVVTRLLTSCLHKTEFFHQLCLAPKFFLADLCQRMSGEPGSEEEFSYFEPLETRGSHRTVL